jgi:predicted GNAT family acetyltransferase
VVETGGYITDVMTMPEHRRQGYGAEVMRRLHADARALGTSRVALTSTAVAKAGYARLGYRDLGVVTLYATPERAAT